MRAEAIALILILVVPAIAVEAAPIQYLVSRSTTESGWYAETFKLVNSSDIYVYVGDESQGEVVGHMIALYDDAGVLLRGATFFSVGGQLVEVSATDGTVRANNTGTPGVVQGGYFERSVAWSCDATCNPSREFTLVVTGSGELDWWGFAAYTRGANKTNMPRTWGNDAATISTRDFSGPVVHFGTPLGRGLHYANDATHTAQIDGTMLLTYLKPSEIPAQRIGVSRDNGPEVACACFAGDWGAGAYTFHYTDRDIQGVEGYLSYADVVFPS